MLPLRSFHSVLFALAIWSSAHGEQLKSLEDAKRLTEQVMTKVGSGDSEAGLLLMKPYVSIPTAEFEVALNQFRAQAPAMDQRFGKSLGCEFISQDKSGENIVRIIYIHRFETHPMRWNFYFYHGKNGWILDTFKTDDDIKLLFQ